jgi:hypothetical protein
LTEIKEDKALPNDKKRYRLHAIIGQAWHHRTGYWTITAYVGNKRKDILGLRG